MMSGPIHITFLGALLALLFTGSMGGLLWWMLHPPAPVTAEVAKVRRSVGAARRIVVPTLGAIYSERGVELACRLGAEQEAEILLTYVIEVPYTLPLEAPLPQAEGKARAALDRGAELVEQHGLPFRAIVERARRAGEGITRVARDEDADMIVMSIRPRREAANKIMGKTTEWLLEHPPCEVIIDKQPE
jgi:nucleotide-binding universal stress UspA family protein